MMRVAAVFVVSLVTAACVPVSVDAPDSPIETNAPVRETTSTTRSVPSVVSGAIATTTGDQSGNRVTEGRAKLTERPASLSVEGEVEWVVGVPTVDGGAVWVLVDAEGLVFGATMSPEPGAGLRPTGRLGALPAGMPPVVSSVGDRLSIVEPPEDASPFSPPLVASAGIVWVRPDGVVSVHSGTGLETVDATALGDSRIVLSAEGLAAVLTNPTGAYPHGVLGDRVESTSVTVFDPVTGEVNAVASAPEGTVFEAISPMWADVDDDGDDEILLTASDSRAGARLVVYDSAGRLVMQSEAIGNGNRWRNLLGVAPLGPDGELRVVDVRTPHIGGIVEWFSVEPSGLVVESAMSSFSTHRIGSRNLDQGIIVDANGDGVLDVLVPSQDQTRLLALRPGSDPLIDVDLGGRLISNLAAVRLTDGTVAVAAAVEGGRLLVWGHD